MSFGRPPPRRHHGQSHLQEMQQGDSNVKTLGMVGHGKDLPLLAGGVRFPCPQRHPLSREKPSSRLLAKEQWSVAYIGVASGTHCAVPKGLCTAGSTEISTTRRGSDGLRPTFATVAAVCAPASMRGASNRASVRGT